MTLRHLVLMILLLLAPRLDAVAQGNSKQEQAELDGYAHFLAMTKAELKELVAKAESGDAEAQYWVAVDSEVGLKLNEDQDKANEFLLKSAQGGFAPAQRRYGLSLPHTDPASQEWLLAAAQQGDDEAEMWMGAATEDGWFGITDLSAAIKWYRMAAEDGQAGAQFLLGNRYEKGHGVEQNYATAAEWFRKAAQHTLPIQTGTGVNEGRYHLALLYIEGRGVPQDYVQAYFLLRLIGQEEYLKMTKPHMTAEQINDGERLVKDWKAQHRLPPEIIAAYHIVETP
jgi:TPR repeat protein